MAKLVGGLARVIAHFRNHNKHNSKQYSSSSAMVMPMLITLAERHITQCRRRHKPSDALGTGLFHQCRGSGGLGRVLRAVLHSTAVQVLTGESRTSCSSTSWDDDEESDDDSEERDDGKKEGDEDANEEEKGNDDDDDDDDDDEEGDDDGEERDDQREG